MSTQLQTLKSFTQKLETFIATMDELLPLSRHNVKLKGSMATFYQQAKLRLRGRLALLTASLFTSNTEDLSNRQRNVKVLSTSSIGYFFTPFSYKKHAPDVSYMQNA